MKYSTNILNKKRKLNLQPSGYSLLEVIVTLAIFGIIMAVMFSGYPRMNAQITYQQSVSEFLSIYRTAQVYGASRGGLSRGDGVYVNMASNNHIIEFTDVEESTIPLANGIGQSNRYYNSTNDLLVKNNTLSNKIIISDICLKDAGAGIKFCNSFVPTLSKLSVVFVRPNQQAHISDNVTLDPGDPNFIRDYGIGYIEIKSTALPSPKNVKCLIVYKIGQIDIQDKKCSDNSI